LIAEELELIVARLSANFGGAFNFSILLIILD
jgi:hypothetical protein